MNCAEARQQMSHYFDGQLAEQLRAPMARHLAGCPACSGELAGFAELSAATKRLEPPALPDGLWDRMDEAWDAATGLPTARWWTVPGGWAWQVLAAAAVLLIVAGIAGWMAWPAGRHPAAGATPLARFIHEFGQDPHQAQQILLASYRGRVAAPEEASSLFGYTPVTFAGAPSGYSLDRTYLLDMPCCCCWQTLYRRPDGSLVALFEHQSAMQVDWLAECDCVDTMVNGCPCRLAEVNRHLAFSCQLGKRHFTIVGAHDDAEVEQLVAWLQQASRAVPLRS